MIITQFDDSSDIFTLAHEDKCGGITPITDFESKIQAEYLKDLINETGFCIKLKELSTEREFSIGRYQKNTFIECKSADSLTEALSMIGINVDFQVEAPEFNLDTYQPQYH